MLLPEPELEGQERPQLLAAVAGARQMLFKDPAHAILPDEVAKSRIRGQESIVDEVVQLPGEPGAQRHPEAVLAPMENRFWQEISERRFQDMFQPPPPYLHPGG